MNSKSEIDRLLKNLSQIQSGHKQRDSSFSPSPQRVNPERSNLKDVIRSQLDSHQEWKVSGCQPLPSKFTRVRGKNLSNWEISRIQMSKRSYQYPKNYHGMKIPAAGKEFQNYDSKDKFGKLPFLYENSLSRIEHIRQNLFGKGFKRINTVKSQFFGFGKSSNAKRFDSLHKSSKTAVVMQSHSLPK